MSTAQKEFTISRTFDAPRQLVWDACTKPEHMMKWYGPKGFKAEVAKMDFRPGGMYHYCLEAPDGSKMWGRCVYREIKAPEKLVYVNAFSDEKGGVARHPGHMSWPLEMLTTFTFTEKSGKTTLTIVWIPINATEAEWKTFDDGRPGMTQGWTGSLDQLHAYLASFQSAQQ